MTKKNKTKIFTLEKKVVYSLHFRRYPLLSLKKHCKLGLHLVYTWFTL